jgi:hypothetical protein
MSIADVYLLQLSLSVAVVASDSKDSWAKQSLTLPHGFLYTLYFILYLEMVNTLQL